MNTMNSISNVNCFNEILWSYYRHYPSIAQKLHHCDEKEKKEVGCEHPLVEPNQLTRNFSFVACFLNQYQTFQRTGADLTAYTLLTYPTNGSTLKII